MIQTAHRLKIIPDSVISEMSMLSNKYHAINLGSGYPDFDPPSEVMEAAHQALRGGYNQYMPARGSSRILQALADKYNHFTGLNIDPDQHITITCGGTEAMLASILTLCNPGDKVIVFSPYYEIYGGDTLLAGAQPIYFSLRPPFFSIDENELRLYFEQGAKVLVLCNPCNPSGKVFTLSELSIIAGLLQEYNAVTVIDEVYEHIIFPPNQHTYIAALPGMLERTVTCGSLSKTYSMTGWRLGYVIAPPEITAGVQKIHEYLTLGAAAPLQQAAITALQLPVSYYESLARGFQSRCDILLNGLDQAGIPYIPPQGGYFVLADISPFGFPDDVAFCRWMIKELGVAAVPGSAFFSEPVHHLIRLNFAKSEDILTEACQRLKTIKEKTP